MRPYPLLAVLAVTSAGLALVGAALATSTPEATPFEKRHVLRPFVRFPSSTLTVRPTTREAFYPLGAYQLRPGRRQGNPTWFVGKLHFRITFARLEGDGRVYISADTNKRTFAQIEFERLDGRIRWNTYGLLRGTSHGLAKDRTAKISFYNYLQNRGVRPGTNPIRLHVEQFGDAQIAEITVYPDSAIHTTLRSPYPLTLRVKPLDGPARVGESFRIGFSLTTRPRSEPVKHVAVEASYNRSQLRLEHPLPERTFPAIQGSVDGAFIFRALKAGSHDIEFLASSDINNPSVGLRVRVDSPTKHWIDSSRGKIGVGLVAIGLALATGGILSRGILSRRRREG